MSARSLRIHLILVVLAALYLFAGKLGLRLAFVNPSATAIWPPTGIALAAFLILGNRIWPAIAIGAFLVNLTTGGVLSSAAIAIGNTFEGLLGAYLVIRFAGGRKAFERAGHVFRFAIFAGALSTSLSATTGATTLWLGGLARQSDYMSTWLTWWLGDAGGDLVLAPLLILWSARVSFQKSRWQIVEKLTLLAVLIVACLMVFAGLFPAATKTYPLEFLCIPILAWAAFRLDSREEATALFILSGISVAGTLKGFGPFVRENPNESLLRLQAFMGVIAVMTLAISAAISERNRNEQALREAKAELEIRVVERTAELE